MATRETGNAEGSAMTVIEAAQALVDAMDACDDSAIVRHDLAYRELAAKESLRAALAAEAGRVQHGINCPKELHDATVGYLHSEGDDRPYDVDGVSYCGRCHVFLGAQR